MKLIIAIVNNDDAHFVHTGLTSGGFHITKVSSTGGFLMNGNSTFLLGTEDADVDKALEIIRTHSKRRVQNVPMAIPGVMNTSYDTSSTKISVGGATVFIMNIEQYLRF